MTSPSILDCHAMGKYWVAWEFGNVRFGYGPVYSAVIAEWQDPEPIAIATVSLAVDVPQQGWAQDIWIEWLVLKSGGECEIHMYSQLAGS